MKIRKAVIPAAGRGTRFYPYTSVIPKEMLPLGNQPAIELSIEEAQASGITEVIIILHPHKNIIKEYLDSRAYTCTIMYVYQNVPRGLGDALLHAQTSIGDDEYFAVILPDDIIVGSPPALAQLIDVAQQHESQAIAVELVPEEKVDHYGIVAPAERIHDGAFFISSLVEKPSLDAAPSLYGIIGRYVLSHTIFSILYEMRKAARHHELELTSALQKLIERDQKIIGTAVDGDRYDIGTPRGWAQAVRALSSRRDR